MNEFEAIFESSVNKNEKDQELCKELGRKQKIMRDKFAKELFNDVSFLEDRGFDVQIDQWNKIIISKGEAKYSIQINHKLVKIGKYDYYEYVLDKYHLKFNPHEGYCSIHDSYDNISLRAIMQYIANNQ